MGFYHEKALERLFANANYNILGYLRRKSPNILANNGFHRDPNGYRGAPAPAPPPVPTPGPGQACNDGLHTDGSSMSCGSTSQTSAASSTPVGDIIAGNVASILGAASSIQQDASTTSTSTAFASQVTPTASESPVCWTTDAAEKPFPTNIASSAISAFGGACNSELDKPSESGDRAGCIMSQQPAQVDGTGDESLPWITMSVEQIWWAEVRAWTQYASHIS